MRPDWEIVARRLVGLGVRVAIITNGFLFSSELVDRLRLAGVESIAVSLDGLEAAHDKYRQEGSFKRAARALDVLSEASFPSSIITTLNSENVGCLEAMYSLIVSRWSLRAWQLQACSPMGNAAQGGIDYRFDPWKAIEFVERHALEAPFSLGIADNIGYFTSSEGSLRGNTSGFAFFRGCRAGLSSIGIDSVGNVRGCESMYDDCFIEGNVRKQSLESIWKSPEAFAYNRRFDASMLSGPCTACAYGKICAGGCRSYNHFVHGKLYECPKCAQVCRSAMATS